MDGANPGTLFVSHAIRSLHDSRPTGSNPAQMLTGGVLPP